MKIYIFTLLLLVIGFNLNAQLIHSIEFNNGINISSNELKNFYRSSAYPDPVIAPSNYKNNYLIGISSAINLKYLNHYYWILSSQIGYLETGNKSYGNADFVSNNTTINFNILYINLISFNTLFEFKYPKGKIQPSIKFGPRIDYTYIETPYSIDKTNYGFAAGGGLNYQLKEHFDLHTEFIYNWYAKDINITNPDISSSHIITNTQERISLNKNLCINFGIGYIF